MLNQDEVEIITTQINELRQKYGCKFKTDAYNFVVMGLSELIYVKRRDPKEKQPMLVETNEFIHWLKLYGWYKYGMLAGDVFTSWNVQKSADFFTILDNLLDGEVIIPSLFGEEFSKGYAAAGFDFADYKNPDAYKAFSDI